ncbi:hypothetical protein LNP04_16160 [Chryseobacterium sp. C-71]|uniref:hypothetical protein n=1 Tax=Chryseobacterium sp. C-71 TaxID=2893882 RepID=UPI001E3C50F2|nr:hypothetical protein [Chryseobacterium sp. C-71]UFH31488.1 hypothetical protein LNP04_16160 [Chryseobacterium sp. C-71]
MKPKVFSLFFTIPLIFLNGCEKTKVDCEKSNIHIENRWYAENGGVDYLEVKDNDRIFICETINNFSKGEEIVISHNYGYLEIFLSGKKD